MAQWILDVLILEQKFSIFVKFVTCKNLRVIDVKCWLFGRYETWAGWEVNFVHGNFDIHVCRICYRISVESGEKNLYQ